MEEYLETLLEQIRCKKAHDLVRREIEGHMEEQISENMAEGMTRKEAVEAAVKVMGDPVATGWSWIGSIGLKWSGDLCWWLQDSLSLV